ncbi:MAG: SDR family oxidoreductase [Caldilineaceae bacterium]|nr:SDR family oxidoreductase [Caldilineaceae bacterium]
MSILERFSLADKTALVTGGGRGIGAALARALAEAGADVAVADRDPQTAQRTAAELAALGVRTLAIQVDVTDAGQVRDMVAAVVDAWGRLDVAVNSAGIANRSPAEDLTEEAWDAVVDIDLKGIFLCNREEGRVMLGQGAGSIINIASMSGQIVNRPQLHSHYNAAKAGVIQYTRSCAAEWADRGVRVNSLSPGHTRTPMTVDAVPEMGATWLGNTPMGRLGTPEDLQGATIFLASSASAYVTGHDLVVDGGYTLW